jgi:anti-sigma B factor antagonist
MSRAAATFTVLSAVPVAVVKAEGEIDLATAPAFRDVLVAALEGQPCELIIDMAEVAFIDSSGLSVLIDAFKQGQAAGTKVVLRAPSRQVRLVLGISGLDKVLLMVAEPANGHGTPGQEVSWPLVDDVR